ncbi:MAG: iron ABC transporter permease [Deltaproteobacteria bacterium]|nr:iron ABC transporter permease [Deltaproteobacteria bacterium]
MRPAARQPRLTRERARAVLAGLAVLLGASLVLAAIIGGVRIDFSRALDFAHPDSPDFVILFRARLPRVLLGATVGGGLGAAGAALQALLRNPLASPDVIGISGGASIGAILVLALGVGGPAWILVPAAAFAASLATLGAIVRLSTVHGRLNPYSLLLVGVIANTIAAALIMLVTAMVDSLRAQGVLVWLTGSLAQRPYSLVATVFVFTVLPALALWAQARSLNLLALGEETAVQLGTDVARVRRTSFLASALLVGASVSVSGVIGFVGLIVPHCLRLAIGSDQRLLIPASFLGGAVFLVWADTVARTLLAPTEIPVGVLTALCGGPFFIFLLRRQEEGRGI